MALETKVAEKVDVCVIGAAMPDARQLLLVQD